jgi:hypothetical protein
MLMLHKVSYVTLISEEMVGVSALRPPPVARTNLYRYAGALIAALCVALGALQQTGIRGASVFTVLWVAAAIVGLRWAPRMPSIFGVRRYAPTWRGVLSLVSLSTGLVACLQGGVQLLGEVLWYVAAAIVFAYAIAKAGCAARGCCRARISAQRYCLAEMEIGISVLTLAGADCLLVARVTPLDAAAVVLLAHAATRAYSSISRSEGLSFVRAFLGEGFAPVTLIVLTRL